MFFAHISQIFDTFSLFNRYREKFSSSIVKRRSVDCLSRADTPPLRSVADGFSLSVCLLIIVGIVDALHENLTVVDLVGQGGF